MQNLVDVLSCISGIMGDDESRLRYRQPHANHDDCTPLRRIPRCRRAPVKELRNRRDARPFCVGDDEK